MLTQVRVEELLTGKCCRFGLRGCLWVSVENSILTRLEKNTSNIFPGSPKTKLCPLVVGNPSHGSYWIILKTILCLALDFQGIHSPGSQMMIDPSLSTYAIKQLFRWDHLFKVNPILVDVLFPEEVMTKTLKSNKNTQKQKGKNDNVLSYSIFNNFRVHHHESPITPHPHLW